MKKIFTLMLCALTIAAVTSCSSSLSDQEKAVKAKVKELKKAGWKVVGDENLTTVVSKHMEKELYDGPDLSSAMTEHVGFSRHCDNIESGKIAARDNAYMSSAEAYIYVRKEFYSEKLLDKFDSFCKNFKSIYAQKITAELIPSFFLYKKSDGEYIVCGYFLVNKVKDLEITLAAEKEAADLVGIDIYKLYSTEQEANQ